MLRSALSHITSRWRRHQVRRLLRRIDLRQVVWHPPVDSPLFFADTPLRLTMDYVIGPRTLAFGHWHDDHCELLRRHLRPGHSYYLVDVGANAGLVARQLLASPDLDFEGASCFEPDAESFQLLETNLAPFSGVHLHAIALSDVDGEAHLNKGRRNAGDIILTDHNAPLSAQGPHGSTVPLLAATSAVEHILSVLRDERTRLVWKSDTQGYDLRIVAALSLTFWKRVDAALIEVRSVATAPDGIERFLQVVKNFPIRMSVRRGGRRLTLDHIRRFIERADGREFDLLLARTPHASLITPLSVRHGRL